jgi:hypothetical protein
MTFSCSVRYIEPRLGKGIRSPYVGEGAAASIGYPEAWILPIPSSVDFRIGGVRIVVGIASRTIGVVGAVTSKKADIVE